MRWKRNLAGDGFRVLVSPNRSTFTEIWNAGGASDWTEQAIPLGAYAGQPIYLRLEYTTGSYYSSGGVWIDTLWLQDVTNPELEGQPVHLTVTTAPLEVGSYTLASVVEDTNAISHTLSPPFTLNVSPRFNHRLESGGSVTLTSYNGSSERLDIPSEWAGQPVAGIAANAFAGTPVVSVTLPASIATLETGAFADASALQRLFFAGNAPSAAPNALAGSAATVTICREGQTGPPAWWPARYVESAPVPGAGFGFRAGFLASR